VTLRTRLERIDAVLTQFEPRTTEHDPDEPWPVDELDLGMHYLNATRGGTLTDDAYAQRFPGYWARITELVCTPEELAQTEPAPKPSYFGQRRRR
jgi:hypothetical protein